MDADRFDGLARWFTSHASRRGFLRALLASGIAAQPWTVNDEAWAKPGKGKAKGHSKDKAKGGQGKGVGKAKGGKHQGSNKGAAVAAPASPEAAECSLPAESCDGCCQGGQCLPGTDHHSCGHSGMACQNCTAQASTCSAGRECACAPSNCDGCCSADICQAGDRRDACGSGGIVCQLCPEGYVCSQGVCCAGEGTVLDPALAGLPYPAACCDDLLPDASGNCTSDCSLVGCPGGGECCPSTGECFDREKTNCRDGDGRLFQCDPGLVCCQAPDGNAKCGTNGADGCGSPFTQALPATCPEWVSRTLTSSTATSEPGAGGRGSAWSRLGFGWLRRA